MLAILQLIFNMSATRQSPYQAGVAIKRPADDELDLHERPPQPSSPANTPALAIDDTEAQASVQPPLEAHETVAIELLEVVESSSDSSSESSNDSLNMEPASPAMDNFAEWSTGEVITDADVVNEFGSKVVNGQRVAELLLSVDGDERNVMFYDMVISLVENPWETPRINGPEPATQGAPVRPSRTLEPVALLPRRLFE